MRIHVLVVHDVFDTGLAALTDVLSTANELAEMGSVTSLRFELTLAGVRREVRTAQGLRVPVVSAAELPVPDCVLVPAIGRKMPGPLLEALARTEVREAGKLLGRWAAAGAQVAAACIGTFLLAEAGLLDGEEATTTWWLAPLFRQRYPLVRLDESRIIVRSGQMLTAGAALSHVDLGLALVRQVSPELAGLTAKYLVVDARISQSVYTIPNHLAHDDPVVQRFERWARRRLQRGFSLDEAAAALGTSKRTLARRMARTLGKSPLAYFQDLRVECAVHLLKTTKASVDQIAAQVGYADGVTLRALLRRQLGQGVREIRHSAFAG